jgi:hypothetical protein
MPWHDPALLWDGDCRDTPWRDPTFVKSCHLRLVSDILRKSFEVLLVCMLYSMLFGR